MPAIVTNMDQQYFFVADDWPVIPITVVDDDGVTPLPAGISGWT